MNAHDSERIKGLLESLGLGETHEQSAADVIVFNTCTIREKPDQRFAAHLAQAAALKHRDPEKVIAVGGCYAEAQRERIFELYPYVDVAFGPGSIPHLGEWLGARGEAPRARPAARAECRAVCEHAHLPLQSGSSRILKAMRRTYGRERYLRLVGELRDAIPDLALTTDLIVGFPGETGSDFEETLEMVEEVAFDS